MPKETFFNLPQSKRTRILDAAITEFEYKTYQKASVNSIVRNSGISKGSFYQYFEDKRDLYQHLMDLMTQEKLKYISVAMENPDDHDFFELIRDTYRSGLQFGLDNPRYMNIGNMLLSDNSSPLYNTLVKGNLIKAREVYSQLLQVGIERGDISPDINVAFASHIIADLNVSVMDYYLSSGDKEIGEEMLEVLDELIEFIRRGIGAKTTEDLVRPE